MQKENRHAMSGEKASGRVMALPQDQTISLRLFGPFEGQVNGTPLPRLRSRKVQSLLALLTLRAGTEVARLWLAGLLWPDSAEGTALATLRGDLVNLRRALGPAAARLYSPTPRTLCLELAEGEADVLAFDAAIRRGDPASLEEAVALYRGSLLEGCAEEWVFQERQPREQAYLFALEALAEHAATCGRLTDAEGYLRRAVAVDPLRESAQRALMQNLAASGNYAAALLCYRELRLLLHRELNTEPDAETQTVFQQLRSEARRLSSKASGFWGPGPGCDRRLAAAAFPDGHPHLPGDFPPLRSLEGFAHNLPAQLTSFIGREQQMTEVRRFLASTRLLTLTGSGGCGKTRLALQVANDLLEEYRDGVWLVELAPLADPTLVPPTVASMLGVREEPGRPLIATLTDHLRSRSLLLVLDNCEHLLAACAELVNRLLRSCPHLRILATSREPLGIAGEQIYPVPPLALPARVESGKLRVESSGGVTGLPLSDLSTPNSQLSTIAASEAVRLFAERAALSQPQFALSAANAAAVAEICCRLDGIPLAIELAAARVRALPVEKIAAGLDDMFRLLTGGSRTALPRQQTLKAAIDWSYDLLSEPERALLRRLSVFAGGWTLEAAEAVGAGGYPERSERSWIETGEVMGLLTSLVEKSLVLYEEQKNEPRHRLLETVRQYARDRLLEAGEVEAVRRHQQFFLALAQEAETGFWSEDKAWLERIDRDYANLRAALELAVKTGDVQTGFQMAQGLRAFWMVRGYRTEGREKLATLLALPGAAARTTTKAQVLIAAGRLAVNQEDFDAAHSLLAESLEISRELGDKRGIAGTLAVLALVALFHGEWAAARAFREESLALFRELGDLGMVAWSLDILAGAACGQGEYGEASSLSRESEALFRRLHLQWGIAGSVATQGQVAVLQGNWDEARSLYQQALELQQEIGAKGWIAASLRGLGTVAQHEGDLESAHSYVERSLAVSQETGSRGEMASSLSRLGRILCDQGDYATACRHCQQSLVLWTEIGHKGRMAEALEGMAIVAGARGESERGARLFGVAQALREDSQTPLPPSERAHYECCMARLRAALGEERLTEVWAEGRAMTLQQALEYALEHASPA